MADYDPTFEAQHAFFLEQVDERIKMLSAKDPDTRREAAEWLGESCEPKAIPKLAQIYKRDDNKAVQKAAGEALSKFRALERALERGDDEMIEEMVTRVITGEAVKGKRSGLGRLVPLLIVLFILLAGANVLMITGIGASLIAQIQATGIPPTPLDPAVVANETAIAAVNTSASQRDELIAEVRAVVNATRNDAQSLQRQYEGLANDIAIDCTVFFQDSPLYTISPANAAAHPDVVLVAERVNGVQRQLAEAKAPYDNACNTSIPMATEAAAAPLATLSALLDVLPSVDADFEAAENVVLPTPTLQPPTPGVGAPAPTATTAPLPTPTPDYRTFISAMFDLSDQAMNPRGSNGLLRTYWSEAAGGSTDACRISPPPIAEDYLLPPEIALASPQLAQAKDQVNLGLNLVRQGWQRLTDACAAGTPEALTEGSAAGIAISDTANGAFAAAQGILEGMR
ncbi:MAG: HEAT repeat domain-containing protein [Burkholderiales bacterium]|nr:HEAT repeat domain-containing protein [Anaerolineae bacterium]